MRESFNSLSNIIYMNQKLISPFTDDTVFKDKVTLLNAFQEKALTENWTKEEVDQIIASTINLDLDATIYIIKNYYIEDSLLDADDVDHLNEEDNWSPFDKDIEDDRFSGDDDFEIEDTE